MKEIHISRDNRFYTYDEEGNVIYGKLMVGVTVSGESLVWFIPDEDEVEAA